MTLNGEIIAYMKDIAISDVVDRKISELTILYEKVFPEPIEEIFIECYLKTKNEYEYPSLQLFSKNYQCQIENFMTNNSLEIYPLLSIDFINITPQNYDFTNASENSKLQIEYSVSYVMQTTLIAYGRNCNQLLKIMDTYLKPRFVSNKKFRGET
jgi:hypothetical protein